MTPGCVVAQLAIQVRDPIPGQPRYIVDNSIWQQLDATNRAALILHEILYFETSKRGARNSITARRFNAYLSSSTFETWTEAQYDAFAANHLALPLVVESHGVTLDKSSVTRIGSGQIVRGDVLHASTDLDNNVWIDGDRRFEFVGGSRMEFAEDGAIRRGTATMQVLSGGITFLSVAVDWVSDPLRLVPRQIEFEGRQVTVAFRVPYHATYGSFTGCMTTLSSMRDITFDEHNMPLPFSSEYSGGKVGTPTECVLRSGPYVTFRTDLPFELFANGTLKRLTTLRPVDLIDTLGQTLHVDANQTIELNADGRVIP